MYIRPNYTNGGLFIRKQIKSIQGENLIDIIEIQPPIELVGYNISIYFEDGNGLFILEHLITTDYQDGLIFYFVPSEITNTPIVKYKIKATDSIVNWESEFGFIYFEKDLIVGEEL